jgi:Trypsin
MYAVPRLLVRCLICCAAAWSGGAAAWLSDAGVAHAATTRGHRLAGGHWWRESRGRNSLFARPGERPRARAAIVGGSPISVERAPWQVVVLGRIPLGQGEYFYQLCGGAIVGETEVLTAAHCMFNPQTDEPASADDFFVEAGSSDFKEIELAEQNTEVESIRVHPYFNYAAGPGAPDDIAVLALAKRLNLTGPAARSIGVVSAGPAPAEGAEVGFSGFGLQNASTEELTGKLYSLGMGVGLSEKCGGESDALFVCASAPAGSVCFFDEGGSLTSTGPTPALLGILSTFEGRNNETCNDGSLASFVNLAAPEIHDFIEGGALPPRAPRGGAGLKVAGVPETGHTLTCSPGNWSGEPTFTYAFIDSAEGQVLQSGSSATYQLTAADVGRTIICQVQAANAGGNAVEQTTALPPIKAAPTPPLSPPSEGGASSGGGSKSSGGGNSGSSQPPTPAPTPPAEASAAAATDEVSLAGTNLSVQSSDMVLVKLECSGGLETCSGTLTLSAKETSQWRRAHRSSRTVSIGTATFTIASAQTTTVKLVLNAAGRALLSAGHGQLSASLTILETGAVAGQPLARSVHLALRRNGRKARRRRK